MSPYAWPVMAGVPAAGHFTAGGFWHPGPAEGCEKCPQRWRGGEAVTIVEYGPDHRPRRGGRYVLVRHDNPELAGRERDQFYAGSGWRAMDGELRWNWKLHRGRQPAR